MNSRHYLNPLSLSITLNFQGQKIFEEGAVFFQQEKNKKE